MSSSHSTPVLGVPLSSAACFSPQVFYVDTSIMFYFYSQIIHSIHTAVLFMAPHSFLTALYWLGIKILFIPSHSHK